MVWKLCLSKYVLKPYVIQCVSRSSILSISWLRTLCPCVKVRVGNGEELQKGKIDYSSNA